MKVIHPSCAGLDVHQKTITACVRIASKGHVRRETRTFGTATAELLELVDWLEEHRCTHVAMEATGVYWKPVWHVLEGHFELVLAHPAQVKNMPGRKSDVSDAGWIADLLAHGLIRASFVPPAPIQELRELTRTRKQFIREVARETQRIQKTLEDANIKLTGFISDILGVSGRAILRALIAGETDPHQLLQLTQGRLKASNVELLGALQGYVSEHHRFLLEFHLGHVEQLQAAVTTLERRIAETLRPFHPTVKLLMTIPGISETNAATLIAEIGPDMSVFPTAGHLRSWAGLCPGLHESAGKRRPQKSRHGAPWLKTALVQAAWAASRKRDCYLRAQFFRLKSRRGPHKALLAVAASILTAVYHMLKQGIPYRDLGANYFTQRDKQRLTAKMVRKLTDLGFAVTLEPLSHPASP
jgi:transposase